MGYKMLFLSAAYVTLWDIQTHCCVSLENNFMYNRWETTKIPLHLLFTACPYVVKDRTYLEGLEGRVYDARHT